MTPIRLLRDVFLDKREDKEEDDKFISPTTFKSVMDEAYNKAIDDAISETKKCDDGTGYYSVILTKLQSLKKKP